MNGETRMSKEELKKEAEESAEKFFGKPTDLVDLDNLRIFKNAYLASAEPREKRIAELEQKIITYKKQINNKEKALARYKAENETLVDFSDMHKCFFESYGFYKRGLNNLLMVKERLEELEKENAELKAVERMALYSKMSDQLTKAKELLAKWVELFKPKGGNMPPTPIQVETEQFLKENA